MNPCCRRFRFFNRNFFTQSKIKCYQYNVLLENQRALFIQKIQLGSAIDLFEANNLIKELAQTGDLRYARQLFDKMPQRDEVSWTTMITGYVNASQPSQALVLFSRMRIKEGLQIDSFVLSLVLKACGSVPDLKTGQTIHGYCVRTGFTNSVFVGSALLDFYTKAGSISKACEVFNEMPDRNVVSWTAIITGLVQAGYSKKALAYFYEMLRSDTEVDSFTFAATLKACADSKILKFGKEIHAQTVKFGFDSNSFVANTLATMYNKCGKMDYGLCVFDRMSKHDVVSWTSLISGSVQMGCEENALIYFVRMRKSDVDPNEYTFAAVVSACAGLAEMKLGQQFHAHVLRCGLMGSLSVSNAIMTMYSKCGHLSTATMVFDEMPRRDMVSWTTIISGYSQEGMGEEAFEFLMQMRRTGSKPNEFTLASLLSVCAHLANLEQGKQIHAHILSIGLEHDVMIRSSLINMYSRCGNIQDSSLIFSEIKERDIVSWTAMIIGYAEHGFSEAAIDLFEEMKIAALKPDHVSFIGVLTACSHAGLVDRGWYYFNSMQEHGIRRSKEHYGCMVDLLGRAGRLGEAEALIKQMPYKADDVVWSTLLRACRIRGDVERAKRTAQQILELEPNCAGTHITLSNIYAAKGRWHEAAEMRKAMKMKGVMKEPGWSWIKVKESGSAFVAGDRSHPKSEEIYGILHLLASRAKMAGYVPEMLYEHED